jgi:hypothetical protein
MTAACGPKAPGETEGGSSETDATGGESTTDASTTSNTSGPQPDPTTGETTGSTTEGSTGGPPAMCPALQTPEVMFEVGGFADDFQGLIEAPCTVKGASLGDVSDAVTLACTVENKFVDVTVTFGNAAVLLPEALQELDAAVLLRYARADYEYVGRWLAIVDPDQELLLGLAAGNTAIPFVPGEGMITNMFAPVTMVELGGFCPKSQGTCSALGEPAVLQFTAGDATQEVFPRQAGQVGPYAVHAGDSWLSDPDSAYECDGSTDDFAAFVLGRSS